MRKLSSDDLSYHLYFWLGISLAVQNMWDISLTKTCSLIKLYYSDYWRKFLKCPVFMSMLVMFIINYPIYFGLHLHFLEKFINYLFLPIDCILIKNNKILHFPSKVSILVQDSFFKFSSDNLNEMNSFRLISVKTRSTK